MERYAVSACLVGKKTKYNGKDNYNEKIIEFLKDKEYILVCPEVSGGLMTPRAPSEIKGDKVVNSLNIDVTKEFNLGKDKELARVLDFKVTKAILKSKSPSCGSNYIYDGSFSNKIIEGDGIFAKKLKELGIEVLSELDFL